METTTAAGAKAPNTETPEEKRARLDRRNEQQRERRKRKKDAEEAKLRADQERKQKRAQKERERVARETPEQREARLARVRGNSAQRRALKKLQQLVTNNLPAGLTLPQDVSAASSSTTSLAQGDSTVAAKTMKLIKGIDTNLSEDKRRILEKMLEFQEKQRLEREAAVRRHLEFEERQRLERETAAKNFWEAASRLFEVKTSVSSVPPLITTQGYSSTTNEENYGREHCENDPKAGTRSQPAGST